MLTDYINEIKKVKRGYKPAKNEPLYAKYVFRPISFVFTPFFIKTGLTANQITFLSALVGLLCFCFLSFGNNTTWMIGVILYYVSKSLDFIDGNVSRLTSTTTFLGKFLDGMADAFIGPGLSSAIGIGLYIQYDNILFLILGMCSTFFYMYALVTQNKYSFYSKWIESSLSENREGLEEYKESIKGSKKPLSNSYFFNYISFVFILTAFFDFKKIYFVIMVAFIIFWSFSFLCVHFANAFKLFNIGRTSIHLATNPKDG